MPDDPQLRARALDGLASGAAAGGPTWETLGLVLAIVGCFLLANGAMLRDPRALVALHFDRAHAPLRTLRDRLFQRVQTALGFTFLTASFALQLWSRAEVERPRLPGSTAVWVGALVALALALEAAGWWWSQQSFRRHVRAWLRAHPRDLSSDLPLARELGELFGVTSRADDSVESFLARLERELGWSVAARGRARQAPASPSTLDRDDDVEPEDDDLGRTPAPDAPRRAPELPEFPGRRAPAALPAPRDLEAS